MMKTTQPLAQPDDDDDDALDCNGMRIPDLMSRFTATGAHL